MTTPTQYVPPEFQNVIDLPQAPQIDPNAVKTAQQDLFKAQQQTRFLTAQVASINARLKQKGIKASQKASLVKSLAQAKERLASAQSAVSTQQGKVYEFTGQYDKLLSGENRDAYLALKSLFNQYGLATLSGRIFEFVKQGYGPDTISLLLQDTPEYKKRFAGNEARLKAGLPVLTPAEYLSTENAYRQILSQAGLPKGFYDNAADFQNWIAGDVSPTEIKSRVDGAIRASAQADPAFKRALRELYNVDETHVAAYFLDRTRALPILEKQQAAAAIGAAALRRGFAASRTEFENYATAGITGEAAEAGYAQIAETFEPMQMIAQRFGATWTQREAEAEVFFPGAQPNWAPFSGESAVEKSKRLRSQERALFGGATGSARGGLAAPYRAT